MTKIKLKAETRKLAGRKAKKLRGEGFVLANVYGKDVKSTSLKVASDDFSVVYSQAGETGVVDLSIGSKTIPVLIDNVQVHPVDSSILHVDFKQIDLKKKVKTAIPLEFTGVSPAEKSATGVIVQHMNEVEVEALPNDLPDKIVVDISVLEEVDQALFAKDLDIPKNVEVQGDLERMVVNVAPPAKEEEIAPVVAEAVEGEEVKETEEPEAEEGQSEPEKTEEA